MKTKSANADTYYDLPGEELFCSEIYSLDDYEHLGTTADRYGYLRNECKGENSVGKKLEKKKKVDNKFLNINVHFKTICNLGKLSIVCINNNRKISRPKSKL